LNYKFIHQEQGRTRGSMYSRHMARRSRLDGVLAVFYSKRQKKSEITFLA